MARHNGLGKRQRAGREAIIDPLEYCLGVGEREKLTILRSTNYGM